MDTTSIAAASRYVAARPATHPDGQTNTAAAQMSQTFKSFSEALQESEALAKAAMTGDADPHALVQALAQSELAVDAVVTIRNRVVEAYQEILRMPV